MGPGQTVLGVTPALSAVTSANSGPPKARWLSRSCGVHTYLGLLDALTRTPTWPVFMFRAFAKLLSFADSTIYHGHYGLPFHATGEST